MYVQHFGLSARPFQLTPDPRYYYDSQTHRKAMAYLSYGLSQGEGFIVITGDIGTGKSMLVSHLVATVDPARINVIQIVSSQLGADDMLRVAARQMGLETEGLAKGDVLGRIERHLHDVARSGRKSLLVIDEVQNLAPAALEELRMLSNFQLGQQCLMQIFLLGQPEFRERLRHAPELEQLRQRVIATHHLGPMEESEIEPYIRHRLTTAGWIGTPAFAPDAFPVLFAHSDGVPRRLNTLMSRVLLFAALEGLTTITAADIADVVADLEEESPHDAPVATSPVPAAPVVTAPLAAAAVGGTRPAVMAPDTDEERAAVLHHRVDFSQVQPVRMVGEPGAASHDATAVSPDTAAALASVRGDIDMLVRRVEEQDAALRRVLGLLIQWADDGRGNDGSNQQARHHAA